MHTGILLAVEAEGSEDALIIFKDFADEVAWSDWNEHQGRWAGQIPDGILCYKDDPELFNSIVERYVEISNEAEIELLQQVGHLSIEELISDPRYFINWHADIEDIRSEKEGLSDEEGKTRAFEKLNQYRAFKLLEINQDRFNPDMHFFDIYYSTRSTVPLKKRIDENPEKQYIAMWDFHY